MIERLREREENRSVIKHIRELIPGAAPEIRGRDVAVLPLTGSDAYLITTSAVGENVHDAWDEALYRFICSGCMPQAARVRLVLQKGAGESEAKKEAAVVNGLAELGHGEEKARIQILSLDVGLSNSLDESLCEVSFIGQSGKNPYDSAKGKKALAGLKLVCIGNAGAYGSRVLYEKNVQETEEFYGRTFSEISRMRLNKKPRAGEVLEILKRHGDIKLVKACGHGGVYGGLWQLSQIIGAGLSIRQREIPVLQETVEIAEHFDQNPYMLHSAGSWIAVCSDPDKLIAEFINQGIPAAEIGAVSEKEACLIEESGRHLTPVE